MTMYELIRLPEKIPCDKRIHALLGIMVVGIVFPILYHIVQIMLTFIITFSILVIVAFGVEYFQRVTNSGIYDNNDAYAVIIGGTLMLIPLLLCIS